MRRRPSHRLHAAAGDRPDGRADARREWHRGHAGTQEPASADEDRHDDSLESDVHLFDAIAAGASGYLLKGGAMDGFVEALEGLARGESPLSPGLAAKILAEFARRAREREAAKPADPPTASLTERQNQILRQVAEGRHYKEVGRALGLTEATSNITWERSPIGCIWKTAPRQSPSRAGRCRVRTSSPPDGLRRAGRPQGCGIHTV